MKRTLRTRLVLLVVAAMLPLFGLSAVNAWLNADAAVERAQGDLRFAVSLAASSQQRLTETAHQVLTVIAHVPDIAGGQDAGCSRFLGDLRQQFPDYANLGVIGADGYARCLGPGARSPLYFGDRAYFREAVSRRSFVSSEYLLGRVTGKPTTTFALPVIDAQGRVAFVAYAALDLTKMAESIAAIDVPAGAALGIHDRHGTLLAGTANLPLPVGQKAASPVLLEAIKTLRTGVHAGLDGAGQQRLWAFMPSSAQAESSVFVVVSMDRGQVIGASQRQFGLELVVLLLMAFLGGWIAWMMGARTIVKPTREILDATRQVEQGRLDVRIPTRGQDGGDELFTIAAGFNRMAESLQKHHDALAAELAQSQASQEKLRDAQRLGRIGYWEMDLESRLMGWSDEACEVLGTDRPRVGSSYDDFIELIHPDDRAAFEARRDAAVREGLPLDLEFRVITPAGAVRWIQQLDRVQGGGAGEQARRRSGVIRDITEQHASQEHLRLLETCVARLNDMVLITEAGPCDEPGHRIVFVNDAFERHTGYRREEVLGRSPRFLQGPRTQRAELDRIRAKILKWEPVRAELINYTKSGQEFWIELDMVPIADAKGWFTHWVAVERDITRRKLAEQAFMDSEQRYAALFEAAPLPMWVFDMTSKRFLKVNRAALQSYGYSAEEFRAMSIFDIRTETEASRLREELTDALTVRRGRWVHSRKDGSIFPVNIVSQPVQYAGRDARFVVALDMSEQVKAENEVQAHLFTLQRAADAAQAITWHQTLEGTMQEVAEQARGVIGAHQAVVSLTHGQDWAQATHVRSLSEKYAAYRDLEEPADSAEIRAMVCQSNRSVRITQAGLLAHPLWRGGGPNASAYLPMRGWLAIPLLGRNGKNIGLLQLSDKYEGEFTQEDEYVAMELAHLASAAMENSRLLEEVGELNAGLEQKVVERTASLARQEALFRALAQQAPQVVWTANPNGAITYVNRAWFDLMGGTLEDWTGTQRWFAVLHPDDVAGVRANWQAANASQTSFSGIRRLLARDGSCHTMAYRASPVLDAHGAVAFWVGIDADISEVKAIEAALRLSNEELEAFSYSVSHDLRSPLNTIDGFSRLLAKQLSGETGEKVQHYLSRIQMGVAQMGQLIEDLLSLAQVARAQLRIEPVDLSEMARNILDEWQLRQPERAVSVHIESGLHVHGDGRLLRVALENLLGNAWKFSAQQAMAEIWIGQQSDAAGGPVFFVRDNGAGFDMAYADKLFNPFQRLHAVSEFPGTGIGLATVSRVIARHGGRLWADAALGRGATFLFTLPKVLHVL
jgi:PAS domain S-box-containing protein